MSHIVFNEVLAYDDGSYDVEEPCPHCGTYVAVRVDRTLPHLETVCPVCEGRLMICSMCPEACDWSETHGCCMDIAHKGGNL